MECEIYEPASGEILVGTEFNVFKGIKNIGHKRAITPYEPTYLNDLLFEMGLPGVHLGDEYGWGPREIVEDIEIYVEPTINDITKRKLLILHYLFPPHPIFELF